MNTDFQTYKHVDVLGPGEHVRASSPLEVTLSLHPTVVLTNALPYPMDIIVWQVRKKSSKAYHRIRLLDRCC